MDVDANVDANIDGGTMKAYDELDDLEEDNDLPWTSLVFDTEKEWTLGEVIFGCQVPT
jgi:hypothetical protein